MKTLPACINLTCRVAKARSKKKLSRIYRYNTTSINDMEYEYINLCRYFLYDGDIFMNNYFHRIYNRRLT